MAVSALTGFEFGTTTGIAAGDAGVKVFDSVTGTVTMSTTSPRTGTYSMQASMDAGNYVQWTTDTLGTSQNVLVGSFYFFPVTDPTSANIFGYIGTAAETFALGFEYWPNQADGAFHWWAPGTSTGAFSENTDITQGNWYRIDFRINFSASTWVIDWAINGTAETQFTVSGGGATTVASMLFGSPFAGFDGAMRIDDVALSTTSLDYPLGEHEVHLLKPDSSGSVSTTNDSNFRTFSSNVIDGSWSDTGARDNLLEVPPVFGSSADGAAQITNSATDYIAVPMETLALSGGTVLGLRFLGPGWAPNTNTQNIKVHVHNGTDDDTILDGDFDFNDTTDIWACAMLDVSHYNTQTELDNLVVRFGYSSDANPDVGFQALYVEISVLPGSVTEVFGDAALTQDFSLAASGTPAKVGAAALSGDSTLTASALNAVNAASTLVAESSMVASSLVNTTGAAALTSESNLVATSLVTTNGVATLSSETSLTVAGQALVPGVVVLSSETDLVVSATNNVLAAATMTSEGVLAADSIVLTTGTATLTSESNLVVSATVTSEGTATLTSESNLVAVCTVSQVGNASLTAETSLTASADVEVFATSVMSSEGVLSATSSVATFATSAMVQDFTLTADGAVGGEQTGDATLSSESSLTASATVSTTGSGALSSESALNVTGNNTSFGATTLSAEGILGAAGITGQTGSANFTQDFLLSAAGSVTTIGSVTLSSESSVAAAGSVTTTGAANLTADFILEATALGAITGDASLSSESSLTTTPTLFVIGAAEVSAQSELAVVASPVLVLAEGQLIQDFTLTVPAIVIQESGLIQLAQSFRLTAFTSTPEFSYGGLTRTRRALEMYRTRRTRSL